MKNFPEVILEVIMKKQEEITNLPSNAKSRNSKREYPNANVNDFLFDANLNASGYVIRSFTRYRNEGGELFEITGYLFKKDYADTLYWKPRIWGTAGTIQPFVKNSFLNDGFKREFV